MVLNQDVNQWYGFNLNVTGYRNQIDAFTVLNRYPTLNTFTAAQQEVYSGNIKLNNQFHLLPSRKCIQEISN